MAINIDKVQSGILSGAASTKQKVADNAKTASGGGNTSKVGDDQVSLTNTGATMSALEQRISDSTGIDQEKVEAVKEALKRGDYPFNPNIIAERMLDMERLLG